MDFSVAPNIKVKFKLIMFDIVRLRHGMLGEIKSKRSLITYHYGRTHLDFKKKEEERYLLLLLTQITEQVPPESDFL